MARLSSIICVVLFWDLLAVNCDDCWPTWTMIDASGKIPSGMLSGNLVDLGAFDQCVNIEEKGWHNDTVRGKYCVLKIKFLTKEMVDERIVVSGAVESNYTSITFGICMPEMCPLEAYTANISNFYHNQTVIAIEPVLGGMCQTKHDVYKELDPSDWGVIAFLIAIVAAIFLSTMYDVYLHFTQKRPVYLILIAFSIKTNANKLLSVNSNADQLTCLHGIRFLSMMWVVQAHRYFSLAMTPLVNFKDLILWGTADARHMYIINATVSVDTFFVLSGLLVGYGFCLAKDKNVKFNILLYYLHRYLRLTPVLAALVLIHATILPHFGSGPYWPYGIFILKENCRNYWYAPLVYIQNYYNIDEMCIGQSWYLSVDMQLFILSPIILIPLWRWPKQTLIVCAFLVLGSAVSSFTVTYYFDLPGFSLDPERSQDYMNKYYITTHTRFGPYLMGIMLGYYLFVLKKRRVNDSVQFRLHGSQVVFGWIFALTVMLACLFASHDLILEREKIATSFYNGLHRHAWSLGVCWVIFACTQNYGGIVNSFLSWAPFHVLGRFTYTIYLVHLSSQFLMAASSRTSNYFDDFHAMYLFWGDLFLSLTFAVCLTLAFESPMITVEKILFQSVQKEVKPVLSYGQDNKAFEGD